mmetsp:Transcript_3756/g.5128  ORF Transcript_3756/g.5128 Transcript_3756/m.5128 type:complete len:104 (+) Transcript_3756:1187-1498(+)
MPLPEESDKLPDPDGHQNEAYAKEECSSVLSLNKFCGDWRECAPRHDDDLQRLQCVIYVFSVDWTLDLSFFQIVCTLRFALQMNRNAVFIHVPTDIPSVSHYG